MSKVLLLTLFLSILGSFSIESSYARKPKKSNGVPRAKVDFSQKLTNLLDKVYENTLHPVFSSVADYLVEFDNVAYEDCKRLNCKCDSGNWIGQGGVYESFLDIKRFSAGGLVISGIMNCTSDLSLSSFYISICSTESAKLRTGLKVSQGLGFSQFYCQGFNDAKQLAGGTTGNFMTVESRGVAVTGFRESLKGKSCHGLIETAGIHGFDLELGLFQCHTFIKLNTFGL